MNDNERIAKLARQSLTSPRDPGTTESGGRFSDAKRRFLWSWAAEAEGHPKVHYRLDPCGDLIKLDEYGMTSEHGWEIDHKQPVSAGGSDELENLQAMHWRNNRAKGDTWPWSPEDCWKL